MTTDPRILVAQGLGAIVEMAQACRSGPLSDCEGVARVECHRCSFRPNWNDPRGVA